METTVGRVRSHSHRPAGCSNGYKSMRLDCLPGPHALERCAHPPPLCLAALVWAFEHRNVTWTSLLIFAELKRFSASHYRDRELLSNAVQVVLSPMAEFSWRLSSSFVVYVPPSVLVFLSFVSVQALARPILRSDLDAPTFLA